MKETDLYNLKPVKDSAKSIKNWDGDFIWFILFSDYLNTKYKNVTISKYRLVQLFNENLQFGYLNTFTFTNSLNIKLILEEFKNCDKEFIIYSTGINNNAGGHQNAVIINKKTLEAELFEPYGDYMETLKNLFKQFPDFGKYYNNDPTNLFNYNNYLNNIKGFLKELNPKIKFFKPVDFLPKKGLQAIEEDHCDKTKFLVNTNIGFCVAWTMYFIEQRIKNPSKSRKFIIDNILKKVKEGKTTSYVCELIRDYSSFIIKLHTNKSFFDRVKTHWSAKKYIYLLNIVSNSLIIPIVYYYLQ
jgi:hypothetical protein